MSVFTNPHPHLSSSVEQLQKLGPRHLHAIIRGTHVYTESCGCWPGCCGDEGLTITQRIFNDQLRELRKRAKTAMIRSHGSLDLPAPSRHHGRVEKKNGQKSYRKSH